MLLALTLTLALQVQPQADESQPRSRRERHGRSERVAVTEQHVATAFKDAAAKTLFYKARAARMTQDSALTSYDVNAYQRISAGIGFSRLGRERLVFRTEQAGRIRWHRDVGLWIDVTGARTVLPGIPEIGEAEARKELANESDEMLPVPYFPGYEPLWGGPEGATPEILENGPIHPLAEGSEAYYTYRLGDSVSILLPDQRRIQLRAIDVRPREVRWDAVVGTLWFDIVSGQLVRAAYRFAVPMHIDGFVKELDPDAFKDVPGWVKPMIFPMHGEISAITIDYGIYEGRFWLPRMRTAEGMGKASFVRVPFRMEQVFRYNSVNALASLPEIPKQEGPFRVRLRDWDGTGRMRFSQCDSGEVRINTDHRVGESRMSVAIRKPCDLSTLENSPDLPASIYEPGEELFDLKARDALVAEALTMGVQPPLTLDPRKLPSPEWTRGLRVMRYNRIEGLSGGVSGTQQIGGGFALSGTGRIGVADLYPNGEVSIARSNIASTAFLTGYRRLMPANEWGNPLGFGSSVSALLFGRDESFYYRTVGAELGGRTERGTPYEWRFFAERQTTATPETQFSLAGDMALPNITARDGFVGGTALRAKPSYGVNPNGFRVFSDLRLEMATTGDSTYMRGAADLTVTSAGPWQLVGALTLSGASSMGELPAQRRWYLGGPHTIRGQSADTAQNGDAYWLTRGEISRTVYGMRPVVFADFGWVGDRTRISEVGQPMSGAGAGVSLLDGLIRFDVARGMHPRKQWRVDLTVDAVF